MAVLAEHFAVQGVEAEKVPMEYKQYKRLVTRTFPMSSLSEICEKLGLEYEEMMPNIVKLVQCCTLLPVNSATCERGFFTQNRIKCRLRTNLHNDSINDLMRISEDGPSLENFGRHVSPAYFFSLKYSKSRKTGSGHAADSNLRYTIQFPILMLCAKYQEAGLSGSREKCDRNYLVSKLAYVHNIQSPVKPEVDMPQIQKCVTQYSSSY